MKMCDMTGLNRIKNEYIRNYEHNRRNEREWIETIWEHVQRRNMDDTVKKMGDTKIGEGVSLKKGEGRYQKII